jgi:hypothetical protein
MVIEKMLKTSLRWFSERSQVFFFSLLRFLFSLLSPWAPTFLIRVGDFQGDEILGHCPLAEVVTGDSRRAVQ